MAKKKFIPPDGENRIRRRFHQLLHQKPKYILTSPVPTKTACSSRSVAPDRLHPTIQ